MGLSEEAKKARNESSKKYQAPYWLKKAKQYGIKTKGLNEEEVVRLARSKYMEEYWEKKAQNKK